MNDSVQAGEWAIVREYSSGWSALIVPETEGFEIVMPTWVAERIIADHERAAWAAEARDAAEQRAATYAQTSETLTTQLVKAEQRAERYKAALERLDSRLRQMEPVPPYQRIMTAEYVEGIVRAALAEPQE